jgi:hypothetical protein
MVSSNKKDRVWNDPPLPGDTPIGTLGMTVCNVSPETHAFIQSVIFQSDISRAVSNIQIAISYTLLYTGLVLIDPNIPTDVVIDVFVIGTGISIIYNVIYLCIKHRR